MRMRRVFDPGCPLVTRHDATTSFAFSRHKSLGAIRRIFRGSIAGPTHIPVNASRQPLPTAAHDSGPLWVANPSMLVMFQPYPPAGFARRTVSSFQAPSTYNLITTNILNE